MELTNAKAQAYYACHHVPVPASFDKCIYLGLHTEATHRLLRVQSHQESICCPSMSSHMTTVRPNAKMP